MAGPFDAYFETLKQQEAGRTAAGLRLDPTQPLQAAEGLALSKEVGAPPAHVMAFPEMFKDRLAQKRATTALTDAPKLSDWLRADPLNGALAKDDLANAGWWERTFKGTVNALERGVRSTGQSYMQWQATQAQGRAVDARQSFMQIVQDERTPTMVDGKEIGRELPGPGDLVAAAYRYGASRLSMLMGNDDQGAAVAFQATAERARQKIASIPMTPGAAAARDRIGAIDGATTTDQIAQFAQIVADNPGDFAAFMMQVGAESLPAMAASGAMTAVTRNPTAGAATMGMFSGAREWGSTVGDELAKSGHDLTTPEGALAALNDAGLLAEATRKGNARALVIGVMDGLSGGVAGKALAESPVGNAVLQAMAQAVMAGAGEAGGQLAAEGRVTSVSDILVEALADMVTSPIEVGWVAGRGFLRDGNAAAQAGGTAAILDNASQQAQASQIRARAPERFKAMLDATGAGDQVIYVPAQGLREFFQARDLAFEAETAQQWGIDPDTFAEMQITGGRVAVPVSNFATWLAGTDAEAWVRENATMGPDEMSLSEAQAYSDLIPEDAAEAYERQIADMRAENESRSSDQQVFDGFYSQLRAAGRTTDVADKEARVMGAFFRSMADRTGDDALDLARRFGVRVQGPEDAAMPRRRGELDAALNEIRARGPKAAPTKAQAIRDMERDALERFPELKHKRPFTQQIVARGGIAPTMTVDGQSVPTPAAAELAARGITPKTAPGLFRKSGLKGLDNIVASEIFSGPVLAEDGNGYLSTDAVYDALAREAAGEKVPYSADAVTALQAIAEAQAREDEPGAASFAAALDADSPAARFAAMLDERGLDPAVMSNDEIAAALEEGAGETVWQSGQDAVPPGAVAIWQQGLGRVLSKKAKPTDMVSMGRPGPILRQAGGLSDRPLQFMAGKIEKVMGEHPEITKAVLNRIVPRIHDPEYILKSGTDADSIISVPLEMPDGRVLIVSIRKDQRDSQNRPINLITSVYVKDNVQWFADEVAAGRLMYARNGFRSTGQSPNQPGSNSPYVQPRGADLTRPSKGKIPSRADIIKGGTYSQTRRGSIQFPAGGPDGAQTVINLFESADLSTVIHEAGHFFLEVMNTLAADGAAPQAIRDDMAAIRDYLGAEEGAAFTTDQHETFARSLEAYMLEGKAPSLALADVFARVRSWLMRIYRSVAGLDVKLSPQIREVFDRMLATDAEIAAARADAAADPLFRKKPPGMSDADWSTYQRMARRSKEQAEAALLDKTMDKVRREKEAWWKAERKQVLAEVESYTNALPQYRLIEAMANGRLLTPDGEQAAPDVRIDRKALVDQFGAGILAEMGRDRIGGKRAIYGDDGLPPDVAAEMFGFASPAAMVQILQNTRKRGDTIQAEADRIMLERYGDPFTDGTIEQEAMDAIHNEQQAQKNVAEARQMAAQLGRDTRVMTATLYRQRARLMLGRMTVREASAPARFLAAERRAGRDAERAFAKVARGDAAALGAALQAKEQQILNAALYDLSREAEADVAKAREKMQAYGKKSVRQKLEGGYIEQIDDLLDRYDFRRRSPGQVAKTERLREFVDRMIAEGREAELMIDPRMMDDARRVHYSRLSLDEFRGLLDTVANLDHLGRFKQKLIDGRRQRDLAKTAGAVADAIASNIGAGKIKQESRGRYLLDLVLTADSVLVDVDGGDEVGTAYQAIKEDIDAGYVRVDEMNRDLSERMTDLFKVYSAKDMRDMKVERHINGTRFTWSKWKAIAVALNTGNEDNVARLLAEDVHPDQRLTREDLDAVLDTLDKRDWDFVQSMWNLIGSYWPEIEAVTQRRSGVKPGRVEARQVATKFGTYAGGYYPIKYDAGYGHAAAMDARTEMDKFMSAGRFAKAQTKHGHTVERKKTGNGRTLNLDMDVAFTHLRDVVRDIALSEAVDNAYRVLNHGTVSQAFMDAGRKNDLDMMNLWLKDVAQGPIVHSDPLNMFARIVKNNFTLSRLALNLKTAALQLTGVAQSAATVGKRPMARAFADYLMRPDEASREVMAKSEFMRRRQTTFDKDIQDFASDTMISSPMRGRVAKSAEFVARVGFTPLTKVQFYAVDVPTWIAGYRNGLRKFPGDEGKAIAFADRMVARAQDSGAMPDRSAISRGTVSENARQIEWIKLFTTLQGYMIAKFNRGYLTAKQGVRNVRAAETMAERFGATADMATNLMLIYVAESAMMGLFYAALLAGDDEDEPDREKFFGWLGKETIGTVIGGLPVVRDAWSVMSSPAASGGGVYGSITEIPARVWEQVFVQQEVDAGWRRAVADAVGTATGLPTTAAMRPIEELLQESGDRSLIEALMGRNPLASD